MALLNPEAVARANPPADQRTAPAWAYLDNKPVPWDPNTWPPGTQFNPEKNRWEAWSPDTTAADEAAYLGREAPAVDPMQQPGQGAGQWVEGSYGSPGGLSPWKIIGLMAAAGFAGDAIVAAAPVIFGGGAAASVPSANLTATAAAPSAGAIAAPTAGAAGVGTTTLASAAGPSLAPGLITPGAGIATAGPTVTSLAGPGVAAGASAPTLTSVATGTGFPATGTPTLTGIGAKPAMGIGQKALSWFTDPKNLLSVGGLVGSLYANHEAGQAATEAAQIQADSAREALGLQRDIYEQTRADLTPYRDIGASAMTTLGALWGLPAAAAAPPPVAAVAPPTGGRTAPPAAEVIGQARPRTTLGAVTPGAAVTMRAPDGRHVMVPHDRVPEAQQQGGQVVS